jgi:nitrile hydratase
VTRLAEDPQPQDRARQYAAVIARAWTDPAFRHRLLHEPRGALAEHGIAVPADHEVRVVENTPQLSHFVLYSFTKLSA